ncbi:MAG: hypothetical protein AAGC83_08270 [Pseudomonadota bacterium]
MVETADRSEASVVTDVADFASARGMTESKNRSSSHAYLASSPSSADGDSVIERNKKAEGLDDGGEMIDLETLQSRVEAAKRRRGQAGEQLRRERERLRKLLDLTERRFAEMRTIVARYEEDNRRILRENEQLRSMLNAVLSVEEDDSFSEEMENLVSRLGTIVSDDSGNNTTAARKVETPSEPAAPVRRFEEPARQAEASTTPADGVKVATMSAAKPEPQPEPAPAAEVASAAEEPIEVVDIADAKARITEALAAVDRGDDSSGQQARRGGFGFFRRNNEGERTGTEEKVDATDSGNMASEFADVLAELERSEAETQSDSDSFQYNLRPGPRSGS